MDMHIADTLVDLDRARFVHIVDAKGTTVTCLSGELWITRDGSPKDFCVPAGAAYCVSTGDHVTVNAFTPSKAFVARPVGHGIARRKSLAALLAALRASVRARLLAVRQADTPSVAQAPAPLRELAR